MNMWEDDIRIIEVTNKELLKQFVILPYQLYKNDPMWVPPLINDEMQLLLPTINPAFNFCDVKLWIAMQHSKVVGRIATIINYEWQKKNNLNYGRFSRFECVNNQIVANKLLTIAEEYLRSKGMIAIHGPLGFNNLDHQGILVEGFEHLASIGSEYSKEYYQKLIENNNYQKQIDWLEFRLKLPTELPQKVTEVNQYIINRYGIKCRTITNRDELKQYVPRIFNLFNQSFSQLFGTFEFDEKMKMFYAQKYLPIMQPRYLKIIENDNNDLLGFIIAMPSLSKAMQKANGKLFPLGWLHIIKALRHPTEIDLLLTGIAPKIQKLGLASLLMTELWKTAISDSVKYVETTGILENNKVALQMWKTFEHIQHKRKRCYIKQLSNEL